MYKGFIYGAITVISVFIIYNAIASATDLAVPSTVASTNFNTPYVIQSINTKFIELSPIELTLSPIGDSELNAVEASSLSNLSSISSKLMKSDWKYVAQIFESNSDTLAPGTYKVQLFENGKPKEALFFKLSAVNPEITEGVKALWDIGNDVPLNAIYTVKVTQCPC